MQSTPIRVYTGALALLTLGTGAFGVLERSRADVALQQAARWQHESRAWDALARQAVSHDRDTAAWAQTTTRHMQRETARVALQATRAHRTLAVALRKAQKAKRAQVVAAASFSAGGGGSYGSAPATAAVASAPTSSAS